MPRLNLQYYKGSDLYSDGDIEDDMLRLASQGLSTLEEGEGTKLEEISFPILYHFSKIRWNILNWYPFKKDSSVLEIGAGCGALTGLLCQKAERVVAMELSRRRAEINYQRSKDYDNLEILVGNMYDIKLEEKFDYVVINGVMEYAMSFTPGDTPYESFLENAKSFLKEDGCILIAIENRLGLKYFAGAPEDHTNVFFHGIDQYAGNHDVRTFSKNELCEIVENVDCTVSRFYYPYPDYKFPTEIFTDETINTMGYGKSYRNYSGERFSLFSESKAAASFAHEGVMGTFANSFLAEIHRKGYSADVSSKQIEYVKYSQDRHRKFGIVTTILKDHGNKQVLKQAIYPEGNTHIKRVFENANGENGFEKIQYLPADLLAEDRIAYPYLDGLSLNEILLRAVHTKNYEAFYAKLEAYKQVLDLNAKKASYDSQAFTDAFGESRLSECGLTNAAVPCLCPGNVDMIFDNIYPQEDKLLLIDGEWIFDFPIPMDFILWRGISEFYLRHPETEDFLPLSKLLAKYDLAEQIPVFERWNAYFVEEYVGCNQMKKYEIPQSTLSLAEELNRQGKKTFAEVSLYFDITGQGLSEEYKWTRNINKKEQEYRIEIPIQSILQEKNAVTSDLRFLRFDPDKGQYIGCKILSCSGICAIKPMNAAGTKDGYDMFLTKLPSYEVSVEEGAEKIVIQYSLIRNQEEILAYCGGEYVAEHDEAVQKLALIENSRSWKIVKKVARHK